MLYSQLLFHLIWKKIHTYYTEFLTWKVEFRIFSLILLLKIITTSFTKKKIEKISILLILPSHVHFLNDDKWYVLQLCLSRSVQVHKRIRGQDWRLRPRWMPVLLDWFEETMHIQVLFSDVLEISLQKIEIDLAFLISHYLLMNPVTFLLYNVWDY